jgi:hypothetical protein
LSTTTKAERPFVSIKRLEDYGEYKIVPRKKVFAHNVCDICGDEMIKRFKKNVKNERWIKLHNAARSTFSMLVDHVWIRLRDVDTDKD